MLDVGGIHIHLVSVSNLILSPCYSVIKIELLNYSSRRQWDHNKDVNGARSLHLTLDHCMIRKV